MVCERQAFFRTQGRMAQSLLRLKEELHLGELSLKEWTLCVTSRGKTNLCTVLSS